MFTNTPFIYLITFLRTSYRNIAVSSVLGTYMIFRSIRSSIAAFTSISITLACTFVVVVSLSVYEELYLDSVKKDLDGLSSNLANDLLPIVSVEQPEDFLLTMSLLRLDRYENVKFASILDADYSPIELYVGKSMVQRDEVGKRLSSQNNAKFPLGVSVVNGELIAFKQIGELSLPQGYLLIVNDVESTLSTSKKTLLYRVLPLVSLIVLLGILFSSWQNYRMLSPLKRLTDIARKIKRTNDYSVKIEVTGKREVRVLSEEISSMMTTINDESNKNKFYTARLKEQQATMEHMANYDALTSLPSRRNFLSIVAQKLAAAGNSNESPKLLYCDLDGFKAVNDLHGHEIGDKLLVAVSKRLQKYTSTEDVVSRIGGDEFLILLTQVETQDQLLKLAARLVSAISSSFTISGWEINISMSMGVSCAVEAGFDVNRLIANADVAMYRSKLNGKNKYAVFQKDMMSENKRKLDIANAIPYAIKNEEFLIYYQAKVDRHKKVVGFEALIRWFSGSLGFISPVEFITIAEQSGRISRITHWVISQVCKDLKQLKNQYGDDIVVSLNLSANDLKDSGLLGVIASSFEQHNVPPKNIEFEVTESAFLENFEQANEFFDQITVLGSSVALDDFGTGYSSLSYLTKINLNTLKIDKQFIDGIGVSERTTLITKTIVEMAKNLKLKVCAEGVETEQQFQFLSDVNCDQLQGYLFYKPSPLSKLIEQNAQIELVT